MDGDAVSALFIDLNTDYQVGQYILVLSSKNGSVFWDGAGGAFLLKEE